MRLIKYGHGSCGPCGRMSHYDYKVAEELELPFVYIKKNTNEYKTQDHIVSQLKSVPNPTYVLVDDNDKVLGHFSGACDKGRFRERVKELLPGKSEPTFVVTPYAGECPQGTVSMQWDSKNQVYNVTYNQEWIQDIAIVDPHSDESRHLVIQFKPGSCVPSCQNLGLCSDYAANGDKIESITEWECDADIANRRLTIKVKGKVSSSSSSNEVEDEETLRILRGGEPSCDVPAHGSCPDPGKDSQDQYHWQVNPDDLVIDTCKKDGFKLPFRTGSCDAGEGMTCNDGLGGANTQYTPYFQTADGNWIQGKTVGGSGHTFDIPDELEAPGTFTCVALAHCKNSHRENIRGVRGKTCCGESCIKSKKWTLTLKNPDECGEKPEPEPEPPPPCENVECPDCHVCVDGDCVDQCEPGQICENGVCKDPERYLYPSCFHYECCPDCPNLPPGFEEGDNGDCDGRPTPDPVPGADDRNKVYLYDRLNHTFVFCCPIQTDVTWLMRFDTIPPVFQRYITTAASVRAAAQLIDNPQLFQLLKDREQMLRMACSNYELEQGDLNYLGQPDYTAYYGYQPFQTLQR